MAGLRTFISIPLPADVREAIGEFAALLRPYAGPARWEDPRKLHLTLKFLGETGEGLLGEILRAMRAAAAGAVPFTLTIGGFGAFPSLARPRVLWIGCDDPGGTLLKIQGGLERELRALGFAEEERAFHPHVTIARSRDVGAPTHLTSLPKSVTFDPRHTLVTEIFLMKSVLQPAGSEYTVIGSIRLS